jgi:Uma2 family endonuclease
MVVICGEPKFLDSVVDTVSNPVLLMEILSPSTENYDRGTKAMLYRDLPSLQELLLVSQDRHNAELYRRESPTRWSLIHAKGLDASIELTSIGYTLSLAELYADILPQSAAHS